MPAAGVNGDRRCSVRRHNTDVLGTLADAVWLKRVDRPGARARKVAGPRRAPSRQTVDGSRDLGTMCRRCLLEMHVLETSVHCRPGHRRTPDPLVSARDVVAARLGGDRPSLAGLVSGAQVRTGGPLGVRMAATVTEACGR